MNTLHKLLKIAVILAILIEKVKLFGIYFALRRFDCINELL